jgi:hypothetical protein
MVGFAGILRDSLNPKLDPKPIVFSMIVDQVVLQTYSQFILSVNSNQFSLNIRTIYHMANA